MLELLNQLDGFDARGEVKVRRTPHATGDVQDAFFMRREIAALKGAEPPPYAARRMLARPAGDHGDEPD